MRKNLVYKTKDIHDWMMAGILYDNRCTILYYIRLFKEDFIINKNG